MAVSRNYVEWFSRKLNENQDGVVKLLSKVSKGTIRDDGEGGQYVEYDTKINFDVISRSRLVELKKMIDEILDKCKEDEFQF